MGFGFLGDETAGQIVGAMGGLTDAMNAYSDGQQVDRAYNNLASGQGMPGGISSRNQQKAYTRYGQFQQAEQLRFNSAVQKETERLLGKLRQNDWDFDAIEPPKTLVGISAFGHAADLATKFEAGKEALKQRRMHKIDQTYKEFRKVGGSALNEISQGNFDAAVIDMKRASELAPMPYRLTDFDPRSKTYGIEFRSDKEGGWAPTGRRLTIEQTGNVIQQFLAGEKTMQGGRTYNPVFAGAADRYMEATRLGNAQNLKDPSKWISLVNKDGHMIQAVPQNSLDYSQGTHFMVLDEDNGQTMMVDSLDRLPGYVRTTMDLRERKQGLIKGQADIAHTKAQTGKTYAETDRIRNGKDAKQSKITLKDQQTIYNEMFSSLRTDEKSQNLIDPLTGKAPSDKAVEMATVAALQEMGNGASYLEARQRVLEEIQRSRKRQPIPAPGDSERGKDIPSPQAGPAPEKQEHAVGGMADSPVQFNSNDGLGFAKGNDIKSHPLSGYSEPKLDNNGSVWAKDESGQLRRIAVYPEYGWVKNAEGQARRVKGQQVVGTAEYQKYQDVLQFFGLAPTEYGGR
ncbi:hypothetical protein [Maridesulfovibrio sp.]|uniref:hypothetical protein n=1 Tax=Maridesulfovibrio sp. TaxID=2795000 RepID=UPI0029F537DD|nr:hypothetical protein [Maridesulfovibrio sp.]